MTRPGVLITSIGSRAAEGILACLAPLRDQLRVIATNSHAAAPGAFDADVAYLVPPTADAGAFRQRMREIIAHEAPALVLNGRDEEVPALAALDAELSAERNAEPSAAPGRPCAGPPGLFLGPPPTLAPIFNDKYLTAVFAREHGLPFAPTAFDADEVRQLLARHALPLVAKPRCGGHASRGVRVLTEAAQVEAVMRRGDCVLQPYVGAAEVAHSFVRRTAAEGTPWIWNPPNTYHMIDLVVGRDGTLLDSCITRAERNGSVVRRLQLLDDPDLQQCARDHARVLGAAGLRGPLNLQGDRLADGRFVAFEWNARFVGSAPGYALLGRNLVVSALLDALPGLVDPRPAGAPRCTVFRPLVFRAVPDADIAGLAAQGRWQRPEA